MRVIITLFLVQILTLPIYAKEFIDWGTKPHIKRSGKNLVNNSSVDGPGGWTLNGDVRYDAKVSRTSGSGSLKLSSPYHPKSTFINSGLIPVTPGKSYTFAVYMKSSAWPPPVARFFVAFYDSSRTSLGNRGGSRQSNTDASSWQECVNFYTPRSGDAYIMLKFILAERPTGTSGFAWIDDIYFGEGIGFEQPPSPKKAFDGSHVRVDELGNFEVQKNDNWEPFFPLCIFGDGRRPDWTVYSKQGFNAEMRTSVASYIQRAKDAVSEFNPDGMMAGFQIPQYTMSTGWAYGDTVDLANKITEIKNAGLMSHVLLYYWDNEIAYEEWVVPDAVTRTIKRVDVDENGRRLHPIYALQGDEGIARKYNNNLVHMTDVVGDYVGGEDNGWGGSAGGLVILDNIEGQRNPVTFAQINRGTGISLRPRLYIAISKGAKAMGFWRDYYNEPGEEPVEALAWWEDFPNIRREIDQLLPIIRQPHWTTWEIASSSKAINYGIRDYQGEGYVIVANPTENTAAATFEIEGLPYRVNSVIDYFTGQKVASVFNSSFKVTLPGYGTAVYCLSKGEK